MKKFTIWLTCLFFLASIGIANAQTKVITGTVTSSEDGLPIPGVTVVVPGTTVGTTTDLDGKYTLSIKAEYTHLRFQYVGMISKDIPIGSSNLINVILDPDVVLMDEVVVTAIGISKEKKALGYNVQQVDQNVLANSPNADIINSIAGRTSGVQITSSAGDAGAATYITIRGAASITGNNQPLMIVDGMPIISGGGAGGVGGVTTSSRSIDLNPEDIASLTVLKGGAATALYGLRAANGALVITTKSGKGAKQNKKIEFHTSVGFDKVSQLPPFQFEYVQGNNGVWESGHQRSFGPHISQVSYDGDHTYKWDPTNGRIVPKDDPSANGLPVQMYNPYDFFQTGIGVNNRLAITSGNEMGSYYFSMSNLEQNGISPNNEFGRTTVRLNSSTNLTDKISMSANMNYTNSRATQLQKGSNVSGIMLGLLRTAPSFDNSAGYRFPDGTQRNYRNGGGYDNPYWTVNENKFVEQINRFMGNAILNIHFTDYLSLSYNVGIDWYNRRMKNQFGVNSRAAVTGFVSEQQTFESIFNSDLLLNFQKDINDDINIKFSLGNNFFHTYQKFVYGDATGLEIQDFYHLSNSSNNTTTSGIAQHRTMAVFGDLSVSYKDMLYFGATGRTDWSTTMPEQNQSAFYPSASLGFVFTELPIFSDNTVLSFGKIRGSWAKTANIAGPYNTTTPFFGGGTGDGWTNGVVFPFLGVTGFSLSNTLGNPDLKHETMKSWEVGVDLRLFGNRIGIDASYFNNKNEDLLLNVPIASSSGYTSLFMNAASMESKGVEISIDATAIQNKDFRWDVFANFTKMTNIVTRLAEGVDNLFLGGFTVPEVRAVEGYEYRSVFGFDWYRDDQGRLLINDDPTDSHPDGYPMPDNRSMVPIGDVNPDWTANVTNTFTYKDFRLSFMIDIKVGGMLYNGTGFAMNFFGVHERTINREVYYTPEGTIDFARTPAKNLVVFDGVMGHVNADGTPYSTGVTNVRPVVLDENFFEGYGSNFGGGPSVAAMEPADWVRLRDLTFSYTLPIKNKLIKNAEIYFTGKNLWLSTPYTGIDPETNLQGANNGQGMDYFNNPGTKSYLLGFKVTF